MIDLDTLTQKAVEAPDFNSVIELLEAAIRKFGFDFLTYHILRSNFRSISLREGGRRQSPLPTVIDFARNDRRVDFDPVLRRFVTSLEPYHWYAPGSDPNLSAEGHAFLNLFRKEGYLDGLCFPVSTGPGDLALIAMSARGATFDLSEAELHALNLACELVHRRCNKLLGHVRGGEKALLSAREHETMNFLLNGLSNKEIAAELGVSAHTVDMYLRRISDKLRVRNRVQAAVKYTLLSTWRAVS